MAKVTQEHIKAGQTVFMVGHMRTSGYKAVPLELVITSDEVVKESNRISAKYASSTEQDIVNGPSHEPNNYGHVALYLGDLGIEGFKYDSRACQLFTTKEECKAAIEMWAGRNPNFLTEDGEDIARNDHMLDMAEEWLGYE